MDDAFLWTKNEGLQKLFREYLRKYGARLKWKNYKEDILQEACVDGTLTKKVLLPFVKERARRLVAVDANEDIIELAKKRNGHEQIDYRRVDENLREINTKFDRVFSTFVSQLRTDTRFASRTYSKFISPLVVLDLISDD